MRELNRGVWRMILVTVLLGLGHAARADTAPLEWGDGVNLQPSYYNQGEVDLGWDLMQQHSRIRTVRIEIEPGVALPTVLRWLKEAHAHGYRVIATYHSVQFNGTDRVDELLKAANWWRAHYAELRKAAPLTVNVMNEWGSHQQTPQSYATAYNEALAIIREVYTGPIIVDLPGWGQGVYVAVEASPLLADDNLVFSAHLYASAWVEYGAGRPMQPRDLDALSTTGRPVVIGEFGGLREGEADWSALVDRARSKGWPLLAWAWNGDGERMNMTDPYWKDVPRPDRFTTTAYFDLVYAKLR